MCAHPLPSNGNQSNNITWQKIRTVSSEFFKHTEDILKYDIYVLCTDLEDWSKRDLILENLVPRGLFSSLPPWWNEQERPWEWGCLCGENRILTERKTKNWKSDFQKYIKDTWRRERCEYMIKNSKIEFLWVRSWYKKRYILTLIWI